MISDVVEGRLEFILEFIFRCFVEIICFYTGELVLSVVTAGNKKPRWDYYSDESVTKWMLMTELSTWVGMAFWIFTICFIARAISH